MKRLANVILSILSFQFHVENINFVLLLLHIVEFCFETYFPTAYIKSSLLKAILVYAQQKIMELCPSAS
jgi:hypothetical protein